MPRILSYNNHENNAGENLFSKLFYLVSVQSKQVKFMIISMGLLLFSMPFFVATQHIFYSNAAGQNASLLFPTQVTGVINQDIYVPIFLNSDSAALRGVDFSVSFDTKMLSLHAIQPDAQTTTTFKTFAPIDSSGNFDSAKVITAANSTGKIDFGTSTFDWTAQAPTAAFNGTAQVATLVFTPLQQGSTTVSLVSTPGITTDTNIIVDENPPRDLISSASQVNVAQITLTSSSSSATPTATPSGTITPSLPPSSTPTAIPGYTLSGTVFVDTNNNGVRDTGEAGYSGATVALSTGTTAITNTNGDYSFSNLPQGTYTTTLAVPTGYSTTTANPVSVALSSNTIQNFGIIASQTGTPQYVQSALANTGNLMTSYPASFTNPVTSGNTIIVAVSSWNSSNTASVTSVTDNKGNTYTKAVEDPTPNTGAVEPVSIWYAKNVIGGTGVTVTANLGTASSISVAIHEYAGVDTLSPLDATQHQSGSATVASAGSVSTTQANDLLFAAFNHSSNTTSATAGTGYTLRQSQNDNSCCEVLYTEDSIGSTTGAHAATLNYAATVSYRGTLLALKASASTVTTTPTPTLQLTATPTPKPTTIPTNTPTPIASLTPTPTPTVVPNSTPTPTPLPSVTPTPVPAYTLSGTVYIDSNQNGAKDTGETGYAGATVTLTGGKTATTNSSGVYSFSSVLSGTYSVTLTLPNGYTATTSNPATVAVGANTTQNFGIAQVSTNGDWTMYQGNPQHTGTTTAAFNPIMGSSNCQLTGTNDVTPCIQIRWKKGYQEWPSGQAQPVVSGSTVLLANMDGKLYAYNTETGASLWTYDTGSAIAVTPAIYNGVVYFGDLSGKIYGLNLADMTPLFPPIQTGGPIYSSPMVVTENNIVKVFIGSNDGKLYALNGLSGQQLFTYDTGGSMIYSNPAYYNGKIFFAAENMYAYALNSSTGQEVWKHLLDGESNRGDHPIVATASNTVLFHTVPRFGQTGRGLKSFGMEYTGQSLESMLTNYQTNISSKAGQKSEFLYDADTGTEKTNFSVGSSALSMIPLNIWYDNGQNMPIVVNQKNIIFGSFGYYVQLDTTTGVFTLLANYQHVRGDEYTGLTVANNMLLGGYLSNIAGLDIQTLTRQQYHGCKDCGDPPPYQPFDQPLSNSHWGGYTGDGQTNFGSFIIVANGHMYYSSYGWLYAF